MSVTSDHQNGEEMKNPWNEAALSLNLLLYCFQKKAKEERNTAADEGIQICLNTAGNNAGDEDSALK